MLLGAALQEVKTMRSKLTRLISLRENAFTFLPSKKEIDFKQITSEILDLSSKISEFKSRIAKTNTNTQVIFEKATISLQDLILKVADTRSELKSMENIMKSLEEEIKMRGYHYRNDPEIEQPVRAKSISEIAHIIETLEKRKISIDKQIQHSNWKTELL